MGDITSFSYRETQIVKGMLARGDKQHDIASYFGVNGGRIAEVATGNCDYPQAQPMPEEKLPPPGPYVGAKTVFEIKRSIDETITLLKEAGEGTEGCEVAIEALEKLNSKI